MVGRDGAGPGEAEVEAVVALLLEMFDDASPEWAVGYVARAKAEPHRGDCPYAEHKGPITCDRCVWEEYSAKARRIIAARPASPGGDAADLAREVERLRAHFELPAALTAADVVDWAIGGAVEDGERIGKVNRHALRMQERADAATARAVAAERERDEARAVLRRVEWAGADWITHGSGRLCPICGGEPTLRVFGGSDHAPDCLLAAALSLRPSGADPGRGTGDARPGEAEEVDR